MENLKIGFETLAEAVQYLLNCQSHEFSNDAGYITSDPEEIENLLEKGQVLFTTSGERYHFCWG